MKCQECQQRQATLHFTKIINGEKTEIHLCENCAKEKGEHIPGSNTFSIHQLLSGLLHFEHPDPQESEQKTAPRERMCENCQMTYSQFVEIGRFGCASCYEAFDDKLDPVLRRVHSGNIRHHGKIPKRIGGGIKRQKEINALKMQIKEHIESEEFEKAAEVRDHIRSLEKQNQEHEEG